MTRLIKIFCTLALLGTAFATANAEVVRPNIVWITAEDMSANLGCFGDRFATTPNLDRFANESIRFTHAFATAPVCSPARSCLITGVYATSLGTQRLRSHFPLPARCRPFPAMLRDAGYFTSNNVKTDYNVRNEADLIEAAWSQNGPQAHWRQRNSEQPFFAVFNLMTTHQSRTSVWPYAQFESEVATQLTHENRHAPADVPLPPYYPDTPTARREMARYYDCISAMDQQVGQILRELEQDGLADETIVFFFSDHGMGMPRGKRLLHDSGMHVPLMIRIPERYRELRSENAGDDSDQVISFVDFPPTVLGLASLQIPDWMQGQKFLGAGMVPRQYAYGARDRVDEVDDLSRSVRDHRYLYIRNYMPHLSWMQPEWYSDHSELRRELFALRDAGQLNSAQLTYAATVRPVEELYDTSADPYQTNNLAADPQLSDVLERLRSAHQQWVLDTRDIGFLPEAEVWERLREDSPWELARDDKRYALRRIFEAAESVGTPSALADRTARLSDPDPAVRFWGVVGLRSQGELPDRDKQSLLALLGDPTPAVRIEAAAGLLSAGESSAASEVLTEAIRSENVDVVLRAIRALQLNASTAKPKQDAIKSLLSRAQTEEASGQHPSWMFVRFSADALLND